MLVLSRKLGEEIRIGDDVVVTVVEISRNNIKLGVSAPKDVPVLRSELLEDEDESEILPDQKLQQ